MLFRSDAVGVSSYSNRGGRQSVPTDILQEEGAITGKCDIKNTPRVRGVFLFCNEYIE